MTAFPLFCGFRHLIAGHGFVACVDVQGRALLTFEDGEWWVYGVEPAGLCASGGSELEAYGAFKETFRKVLCDSAQTNRTFEAFRADVSVISVQKAWEDEWQQARLALRSHSTVPTEALAELESKTMDVRCSVEVTNIVEHVEQITPDSGCADALATAA